MIIPLTEHIRKKVSRMRVYFYACGKMYTDVFHIFHNLIFALVRKKNSTCGKKKHMWSSIFTLTLIFFSYFNLQIRKIFSTCGKKNPYLNKKIFSSTTKILGFRFFAYVSWFYACVKQKTHVKKTKHMQNKFSTCGK